MGMTTIDRQLLRDIVKTFRTPHGKRVLQWLEARPTKEIRLTRHPEPGKANAAFLNPNAAMYQAGMLDQVRVIKKYQKLAKDQEDADEQDRQGRAAGED